MPRTVRLVLACLLATVSLSAQQAVPPGSQVPPSRSAAPPSATFRLGVSYVEVDARVTDKQGNFVGGLTKDDFRIFQDGKPEAISVFSVVQIPTRPAGQPLSAKATIEPDVVSNAGPFNGRLYAMIVDDLHTRPEQTQRLAATAKRFVEQDLGPNDLMAVVHTFGPQTANQWFTNDKALLLAAINKTSGHGLGSAILNRLDYGSGPGTGTGEYPKDFDAEQAKDARVTYDTVRLMAHDLANVRNRRKAILLVSDGIDYDIRKLVPNGAKAALRELNSSGGGADPYAWASLVIQARQAAIDAAVRNNVVIYGIDPRGLTTLENDITEGTAHAPLKPEVQLAQKSLRAISDATGGFAVVDRNDFAAGYRRIVAENSSYYVLGFHPLVEQRNGKFHKITVRVDRPGVSVVAREGYLAPKSPKSNTPATAPTALERALDSPIPVSGLTMHLFAAPFKGTGSAASVVFGTELKGHALALNAGDKVEIAYLAINAEGRIFDHERYAVTLNSLDPTTRTRVERYGLRLLNRLTLPPGHYQLHVAVRDDGNGRLGSVVDLVDVPDFTKGRLLLSGVVMTSGLGAFEPTVQPDARLRAVLPAPPVGLRQFPQNDTIVVYGEAYDNEPGTAHRVTLATTVTDGDGRVLFKAVTKRDSSELHGQPGGYGFTARVPMEGLSLGAYVLTVSARSTDEHVPPVTRAIPFTVVPKLVPPRAH